MGLVGVGGELVALETRPCFLFSAFSFMGVKVPGETPVLILGNSSVLVVLDTVLVGLGSLPTDMGSSHATCTLPGACKGGLVRRMEVVGGEADFDIEPL